MMTLTHRAIAAALCAQLGLGLIDDGGLRLNGVRRPQLRRDLRFQRLTQHLHRLGPRPVAELLLELARDHGLEGAIMAKLEVYSTLAPSLVERLGGRDWAPPPLWRVA
jgi:hypothetical protein